MKSKFATFVLGFAAGAIALTALLFAPQLLPSVDKTPDLPLDTAISKIRAGEIQEVVQHSNRFDLTDEQGNKFYLKVASENDTLKNTVMSLAINKAVTTKSIADSPAFFGALSLDNVFAAVWLGISVLIFVLLLQLVIKNFTSQI